MPRWCWLGTPFFPSRGRGFFQFGFLEPGAPGGWDLGGEKILGQAHGLVRPFLRHFGGHNPFWDAIEVEAQNEGDKNGGRKTFQTNQRVPSIKGSKRGPTEKIKGTKGLKVA